MTSSTIRGGLSAQKPQVTILMTSTCVAHKPGGVFAGELKSTHVCFVPRWKPSCTVAQQTCQVFYEWDMLIRTRHNSYLEDGWSVTRSRKTQLLRWLGALVDDQRAIANWAELCKYSWSLNFYNQSADVTLAGSFGVSQTAYIVSQTTCIWMYQYMQ